MKGSAKVIRQISISLFIVTLVTACANISDIETQPLKANDKIEDTTKSFTCSDGLLVSSHEQCTIYDPILPSCFDSDGNFVYKVDSTNLNNILFLDNLEETIPLIVEGTYARDQGSYWNCKLVKLEITGHVDPTLSSEAKNISILAAKQIEAAFLKQGVQKELITVTAQGGATPFWPPQTPTVADELNNRVNVKAEFEIVY